MRDLKTLIESRYDCPLILQLPYIFVKTTIITTLRRRILEVKSSKEIISKGWSPKRLIYLGT